MSFLETGKVRLDWLAAATTTRSSIRPDAGCAQCGNRLDPNDFETRDHSGKCFNCINWVSDEDECLDELDD